MYLRRAALLAALACACPISARATPILGDTNPPSGTVRPNAVIDAVGSDAAACHSTTRWLIPESSAALRTVARVSRDLTANAGDEDNLTAWDRLPQSQMDWVLDAAADDILSNRILLSSGARHDLGRESSVAPPMLTPLASTDSVSVEDLRTDQGGSSLGLGPKPAHASSEPATDSVPEHLLFLYLAAGGFVLLSLRRRRRRRAARTRQAPRVAL